MNYLERSSENKKNRLAGILATMVFILLPVIFAFIFTFQKKLIPLYILVFFIIAAFFTIYIFAFLLQKSLKIPYDENFIYIPKVKNYDTENFKIEEFEKIPFAQIKNITQKNSIKFINSARTRKITWFITKENGEKIYFNCDADAFSDNLTDLKNKLKNSNPNAKIVIIDFKNNSTFL